MLLRAVRHGGCSSESGELSGVVASRPGVRLPPEEGPAQVRQQVHEDQQERGPGHGGGEEWR
jgi:hypothetical protein